jgi:hypothetical protein
LTTRQHGFKGSLADQFATTCFSVNIRILKNLNFEMHVQKSAPILLHRILLFGLFFILLYLSFSVLKYFIVPVVWAIIIAYMTWPIYRWILKKCGEQRTNLSATLMLLLIILVIGVPFVFAIFILQNEGQQLFVEVQKQLFSGHLSLPAFITGLPIIGHDIQRILDELNSDPHALRQNIVLWLQSHVNYGRFVLGEISRNLVKLFFALFSLFFFYRDGITLLNQFKHALEKVVGPYSSLFKNDFPNHARCGVRHWFNCNCASHFGRSELFYRGCSQPDALNHCHFCVGTDSIWYTNFLYRCQLVVIFTRANFCSDWRINLGSLYCQYV